MKRLGHAGEGRRSQGAIDEADAVEQHRRGEGPDEDVLDPRLVGLGPIQGVARQDVQAEAEKLQRDVGRQELARGYHGHHGQEGEEQDPVVFAGAGELLLDVVHGGQQHERPYRQQEDLEEDRVLVDEEEAAVQLLVAAGEIEDGAHGPQDPGQRDVGQPVLARGGDKEVQGQDQQGQPRHDELRQEQGEVNVHTVSVIRAISVATPLLMILIKGVG